MFDLETMADALWRATTYASVCQLHLRGNVLLSEPLRTEHVKARPAGHWGTVPGTAWAMAHIALAAGEDDSGMDLVPLLGAGHAGVAQLSMTWLSGELEAVRPRFAADAGGLERLCQAFPEVDGLGAEVSPGLFAGDFLGGRLGGCLPFAQGASLDAPDRILLPVIGDGECETPTTAAAWLAHAALRGARVLPVIHVNGFRMGGLSLLGSMSNQQLCDWAAGLGWQPVVVRVGEGSRAEHALFHEALTKAAASVDHGQPTAIFLRCQKGWGGPEAVGGLPAIGTPRMHKTPLVDSNTDAEQLRLLESWLASYRPSELFDAEGRPRGPLAAALDRARWHRLPGAREPRPASTAAGHDVPESFAVAVESTIRDHVAEGDFRVFSPDELDSNRLGGLAGQPWSAEVLAEEILLEWLAGWTASGRSAVLISYEAFASLLICGLVAHLKARRLATAAKLPSLNLLLTSYGWHNVYTHGDPSAATALLAAKDSSVRMLTPADPARLAMVLDEAFRSRGQLNIVVAGKHSRTQFPMTTIEEELTRGVAIWPHLSNSGEPDVTIVTAGDLPAQVVSEAVEELRKARHCRIRVVNLTDLTVLGNPTVWPRGLSKADIDHYLGIDAGVLVVTLGHPAAVWGLLEGRLRRPVEVIGWRDPAGPAPQAELARAAGLDAGGLDESVARLLGKRSENW